METRCLICESTVVLTKEQAQACALLVGTVGGFLLSFVQARSRVRGDTKNDAGKALQAGLELITGGVQSATSGCAQSWEFAQDVQRYHFGDFDCLCLRCGARFDQQPSDILKPQPDDPPTARLSPRSTGDRQAPP